MVLLLVVVVIVDPVSKQLGRRDYSVYDILHLVLIGIFQFSPRRPYAPSSINDIRLNDMIKFSRPGGKISKGVVKYIGTLPGKSDQYLGLELEDEGKC